MPRFHFNVYDGKNYLDHDGAELSSVTVAQKTAVITAAQMLAEHADQFWDGDEWRMEVTDERGQILFTLTFHGSISAATRTERPT